MGVGAIHGRIEVGEHFEATGRDATEHLSAVGAAPVTSHQTRLLEFIEKPRNRGPLVDHAVTDSERGQAIVAGAAQNAQHVVLGETQSVGFDEAGVVPRDHRGRAQQGNGRLLGARSERASLLDLLLDGAGAGAIRGHWMKRRGSFG